MNAELRTVIVAPLTSARRVWPARVPVKIARIAGDVALDQMGSVDKARLAKRVGALSATEAGAALGRLAEMFGE